MFNLTVKDKSWYWLIGAVVALVLINGALFYFTYYKPPLHNIKYTPSKEDIEDREMFRKQMEENQLNATPVKCKEKGEEYEVGEVIPSERCISCRCEKTGLILCKNEETDECKAGI